MKQWVGVVACLAGAVAVVVVMERRQAAAMSGMQAQIGALESRGPQPSGSPDRGDLFAAMRLAQLVPPAAPAASAPAPAVPSAAASAHETQRPPPLTVSQVRDHYDATWAKEPVDSTWAVPAAKVAREHIAAQLPQGSTLESLDCRTSMCRIETSHGDPAQYHAFIDGALRDPETHIWNGGYMFAIESDDSARGGSIKVVSFLARDGAELPPVTE